MQRYAHFVPGEYYHIYNRGINKNKIFFSDNDWKYFQRLLYIRNDAEGFIRIDRCRKKKLHEIEIKTPLVDIQSYALMPNHFHILMSEREAGGISTFMKRLLTSYSMYINKKYNRSGSLMCRPFRSTHVGSDEYMRWLVSYIHLNPVKLVESDWKEKGLSDAVQAQKFLQSFMYASYTDYYIQERDETRILNKNSLPFFISDLEDVETMIATAATINTLS